METRIAKLLAAWGVACRMRLDILSVTVRLCSCRSSDGSDPELVG